MIYTLRHRTPYRYGKPVRFARCALRLTPQQAGDQTVLSSSLRITPTPTRLEKHVGQFGEPVVTAIIETALDVAKAMVHMHAAGVLHSDLKARNIMLKTTGMEGKGFVGKVRDRLSFGLAAPYFCVISRCVLNEGYCPWCTICFVFSIRVWAKHLQFAPP